MMCLEISIGLHFAYTLNIVLDFCRDNLGSSYINTTIKIKINRVNILYEMLLLIK